MKMYTLKYERKRRRGTASTFENLPEEAKVEIFARLPVKPLMRFRCVCRSWNTIISSQSFINFYHERNLMMKTSAKLDVYLLIRTNHGECLLLFCAETYTKCLDLKFPKHDLGSKFFVHGSCNGLLCISHHPSYLSLSSPPIYLWNPSIRKFKRLPKGLLRQYDYGRFPNYTSFLAIGFQREENDYRVVKIHNFRKGEVPYEVEVYSLKSNSWRRISAVPPLSSLMKMRTTSVHLNGVVYWKVFDHSTYSFSILSFDLKSEVFRMIISPRLQGIISLQVLEKSLAVFRFELRPSTIDIWFLESDTWKMTGTILVPADKEVAEIAYPFSFARNAGVHIAILAKGDYYYLGLYDPKSPLVVKDTKIGLHNESMYVDAYKESHFTGLNSEISSANFFGL